MEKIEDAEGVRIGLLGDLILYFHYAPMTLATVDVVRRVSARVIKAQSRVATVVVLDAGMPTPTGEVREGLIRVIKGNEPNTIALAVVMQGQGFGAAAVRAALAGVTLIARTRHPIKTFATISEGMRWMAATLGSSSDVATANTRDIQAFLAAKN